MGLACPRCDRRITPWQLFGFFRLFSISCPGCRTLLALDGRGRAMLFASILASIAVVWMVDPFVESELIILGIVVAGFAIGCIVSAKMGRLGVSPENTPPRS